MLGPAENAMSWVYCCLPMMLNKCYKATYNAFLALN